MRTRRIAKWIAVAGAGCVVGVGMAIATPALAASPAEPAAPQYQLVTKYGDFGAFAECPAGFTVTGGGVSGAVEPALTDYYSKPADDLSGWMVSGGRPMVAYAICVSNG